MRRVAVAIAVLVVNCFPGAKLDRGLRRHRPAKTMRMLATAYCDRGPTRSGVRAQPGVVAADLRRLPLGTRLRVLAPGQSYAASTRCSTPARRSRDTTWTSSCRAAARAKRFGKRPVQVRDPTTTDHDQKNREDRRDR